MALDETGNFYGLSKQQFDEYKDSDGNRPNDSFIYETLLSNKLKEHSISDLEDFIEHQVNSVNDKIDWLRNLDRMVNKNDFPFFEETQNKRELSVLVPRLIKKYKNGDKSINSIDHKSVVLVDIDQSVVINTKFTINELVLLFDLLNLEDLIHTDSLTKDQLSNFLSSHFSSLMRKDSIKPGSIRQALKKVNDSAFQTLDDKLINLRKRLRQKSESTG
ncbi:MAG: hypothetical protein HWD84_10465 [Flavobacteriaceae bacterium]|nr:hypothetical protein [Flavobacteriaceae bacterium]